MLRSLYFVQTSKIENDVESIFLWLLQQVFSQELVCFYEFDSLLLLLELFLEKTLSQIIPEAQPTVFVFNVSIYKQFQCQQSITRIIIKSVNIEYLAIEFNNFMHTKIMYAFLQKKIKNRCV